MTHVNLFESERAAQSLIYIYRAASYLYVICILRIHKVENVFKGKAEKNLIQNLTPCLLLHVFCAHKKMKKKMEKYFNPAVAILLPIDTQMTHSMFVCVYVCRQLFS